MIPYRPLRATWFGAMLAATALAACGEPVVAPPAGLQLGLEEVASGLDSPVFVTSPIGDGTRLFVVEQGGRIKLIKNGSLLPEPFLDLRQKVSNGSEQGLLSMAFHPDYAINGVFLVSYTNVNGDSRVSTFRVTENGDVADAASETIIIGLEQPFPNHNGGHLEFGPFGFLFVAFGDGGSAGDPNKLAQHPETFHGKILRMIVRDDGTATIPPGNPFVGQPGWRWEIWAGGFRNPWRFSFDRDGGDLYVADVGQDRMEEISIRTAGQGSGRGNNFGWSTMEGSLCFNPMEDCNQQGLVQPAYVYSHADGCSVTGGYVYRGSALPAELRGAYFFGDYCGGWIRSFRYVDINGFSGRVDNLTEWSALATPQLTSFGEDAFGELYIVSATGTVHRIVQE